MFPDAARPVTIATLLDQFVAETLMVAFAMVVPHVLRQGCQAEDHSL